MKDITFNVSDCPLCRIFTNKELLTKVYYLDSKGDFIILDCLSCKIPMVVIREHLTSVDKELWGRILYASRKLFGSSIILRLKTRTIHDHWHAHITHIIKSPKLIPDIRNKII